MVDPGSTEGLQLELSKTAVFQRNKKTSGTNSFTDGSNRGSHYDPQLRLENPGVFFIGESYCILGVYRIWCC